jgi:hypothetical protein
MGFYTTKMRCHAVDLAKRNQQIELRRFGLHGINSTPTV